jgi:hypothetical protein
MFHFLPGSMRYAMMGLPLSRASRSSSMQLELAAHKVAGACAFPRGSQALAQLARARPHRAVQRHAALKQRAQIGRHVARQVRDSR